MIKCVNCGSELTKKLLHLQNMPLTDNFIAFESENVKEYISDINIYECIKCSLVQNPINDDLSSYYLNYEYSSGHSDFTREFMELYADSALFAYKKENGRSAKSVIEIGSGDGEQLLSFIRKGVVDILGVEPSYSLSVNAESKGVKTYQGLFDKKIVDSIENTYDICISSYTFDHIKSPVDYIRTAYKICNSGGILAIEIHDLDKIYDRSEWCLFEHEHTIYMNQEVVINIFSDNGFEVVEINPIPEEKVRANSLIVIATKSENISKDTTLCDSNQKYNDISTRIKKTIDKIDKWIESLGNDDLIGWGVGGRGVMTLASLQNYSKFSQIIDSNYSTGVYSTPKTHIPVSGLDSLKSLNSSWCLIFSFGYYREIREMLIKEGFNPEKIISLEDFYGQ